MKYESTILKRLIDTYGVVGNPCYISEIIKEFIVRGKELYPQLFTYQSDWLAHIDEFGLTPEYTVSYTGQHIYAPNTKEKPVKSAILSGNTLVNIFDVALPTEIKNNHDITLSYQVNANETYTFIVEAESTSEKYQGGFITANGGGNGWNGFVDNGISKFTVTTSEATNKVRFSAQGASNTVQIKKCMIIKGDYSNQDIPFFTGMQSVKVPVLTTTGKNLFNNKIITDYIIGEKDGGYIIDCYKLYKQPYILEKPLTGTFTFTYTTKEEVGGNNPRFLFYFNDGTTLQSYNGQTSKEYETYSITINNKSITKIGATYSNLNNIKWVIKKDSIQLEQGSTATSYEPFKANILSTSEDVTLRGIDDVQDDLNLMTGELTQRIGEIVLNGSEDWEIYGVFDPDGYSSFVATIPSLNNVYYNNVNTFISGDFHTGSWIDYRDAVIDELVYNHDPNRIGIRVKSERASNVNEIKSFLSTNNIRINYALASESIKTVDLTILDQNGQSVDHLKTFNGGTHVYTSSLEGSLVPSVDISVVTNLEETLKICSLEGNTM